MLHYASHGHLCYAPDMPGFGGSFDPASRDLPFTIDWFCSIETDALQAFGLLKEDSKGFHLVGHHSGAALAPRLAVLHQKFVRSVTMIGPTVLSAEERAGMKATHLSPFNIPVVDGSHLLKTWNYLVESSKSQLSISTLQQEGLDHIRAWEGRVTIYGALWEFDGVECFKEVTCPMLALCSEEDVLWKFFWRVDDLRPDVKTATVGGANFSIEADAEGCIEKIDEFLASLTGD